MKRIHKYLLTILLLSFSMVVFSQTGILKGTVSDDATGEPIPFVNIHISDSTGNSFGTTTDYDGNYTIKQLPAGNYVMKTSFVGYKTTLLKGIIIDSNKITFYDVKLKSTAEMLDVVEIIDYKAPLFYKDQTATGSTITTHNINKKKTKKKPQKTQTPQKDSETEYVDYAGKLTATELNDFSKWNLWEDIASNDLKAFERIWQISTASRYSVQVIDENSIPIVDAQVLLLDKKDTKVWSARTDNTGKVELWNGFFDENESKKLKVRVIVDEEVFEFSKPKFFHKGINVYKLPSSCRSFDNIDIAFVVDATGSMGDEINFLRTDLKDIIHDTKKTFPSVSISTSSVFYRCYGNSYVTKMSQFTTDISSTVDFIDKQQAAEGGDEVVEEALRIAIDSLNWRKEARARILFLILDEQPLTEEEVKLKVHRYIRLAASKGIRIVPVVASAENLYNAFSLEYIMRSIALATNGTTVFLTDHSGIGNEHATPTTDEYNVELLNNLLKRLIYQFSYVTPCDGKIEQIGSYDSIIKSESPIIAIEVVDSTIITDNNIPDTILVDLTVVPVEDSIDTNTNVVDSTISNNVITSIVEPSIVYYPNPTSGVVNIKVDGEIGDLFLFDISGKLMAKYDLRNKSELQIDISHFGSGYYFLKFHVNNKLFSGKIILTH